MTAATYGSADLTNVGNTLFFDYTANTLASAGNGELLEDSATYHYVASDGQHTLPSNDATISIFIADVLCDIGVDANNDGAISPGYNGDEQGNRWWGENPPDDGSASPGKLVPLGSNVEEDGVPILLNAWCDVDDGYTYGSASRPRHFDNEGPSLAGFTHRITISEPDCVEVYDGGYNRLYPVDGVLELTSSPGSLLILGTQCGEVTFTYDVLSPADEVVATDTATLTVIDPLDVDIDSDNNNGLGAAGRVGGGGSNRGARLGQDRAGERQAL